MSTFAADVLLSSSAHTHRSAAIGHWYPSGRPPRNRAKPVPWQHRAAVNLDAAKDPAGWTLTDVRAADDLGMVRTGMTYDKDYGTSASFFEKPRRLQFMEGPNEPAVADHLEMNPRYLDFQFQPLDLTFRRADGKVIHKYPDVLIEFDDNTVRAGEIKSNQEWFDAAGVRWPLDRIDIALATIGLGPLLRIKGEDLRQRDSIREAHEAAIDARLSHFDPEADVYAVRSAVGRAGGSASYGTVVAALGGKRSHGADKLYAMMLRRIVAFDLFSLPTADTEVRLPRQAHAYALRDTLKRLRRKVA